MAATAAAEAPRRGAMTPVPYRVVARRRETADTWTLELEPQADPVAPHPGQFVMLYAHGVGEVPISTSGSPRSDGVLTHTIRSVGPVSAALCASEPGAVLGVRGPFGTVWPLDLARGRDLVVVTGGIGLAPLRPAVLEVLSNRSGFRSLSVLVGARTPDDLLFVDELESWRSQPDVEVLVTVDAATPAWRGRVGLVTTLVPAASFDPVSAVALVCGPEIMMRLVARALVERGLADDRIWLSMERNMRCGVGHCGHCQLGPFLVCRDGPVLRHDAVEPLLEVREL